MIIRKTENVMLDEAKRNKKYKTLGNVDINIQNEINQLNGNAVNIKTYIAENGHNYTEEYLKSLYSSNKKLYGKMMFVIEQLKNKGRELKMPYRKYLDDGIYELRAEQSSNYSRVIYFFAIGSDVILTNGFTKDVDKTPENALNLAKKLRNEYSNKEEN